VYGFSRFTKLKELTVSASELFGNNNSMGGSLILLNPDLVKFLPPVLETLRLHVHRVDLHGDEAGRKRGVWCLLQNGLASSHRWKASNLKRIIVHLMVLRPRIPTRVKEAGQIVGVDIRLATADEVLTSRERYNYRLLMS
jgi:hypothetical protein